jgi:hypothetical protein
MKMNIIKKRKGALLLQTLVLSVIMAMIGVMILKWALARYILASRFYRSSVSRARVEGCLFKKVSEWGKTFSDAPNGTDCNFSVSDKESADKNVKINVNVISGTAVRFKIEQDDYY